VILQLFDAHSPPRHQTCLHLHGHASSSRDITFYRFRPPLFHSLFHL
jgi:hypothetical protein